MMTIIFIDSKTGKVNYAIEGVSRIRYITPSEVGFDKNSYAHGCSFPHSERLEVRHEDKQ